MPGPSTFLAVARRHRSRLVAACACAGPLLLAPQREGAAHVAALAAFAAASLLLPPAVRWMARIEDALNLRTARVTPARLLRFGLHLPLAAGTLLALGRTDLPAQAPLVALVAVASAQAHAAGATLACLGRGDRLGNGLVGIAAAMWAAALLLSDRLAPLPLALVAVLAALAVVHVALGLASDRRAARAPRRGVGVFFGTFNPVHRTHLAILADAFATRGLERVYVHPTTVPKLHRDALARGEITFREEDGMRVYRTTGRADPGKDYFPTGNRFFDYPVRNALLKAALADAGLDDRVRVLELPELYEAEGFRGILAHVRRRHPGTPLHGLHGSDPGGMWVRTIFDMTGRIYPFPVRRRDGVSATAIRAGGVGLTTPSVERFLAAARAGRPCPLPDDRGRAPEDGVRTPPAPETVGGPRFGRASQNLPSMGKS